MIWSVLILLLYLGLIFTFAVRGNLFKTFEDFILARGRLGPYALGVSFSASYTSVSLFLGVSGWAYSWGESVLFYTASIFGFTILGLILFAKKFREIGIRNNSLSLADWIGTRYRSPFLRTGVGVLTLFNITYIAGQFIGVAYLLQSVFQLPYSLGVTVSALVVVLYVSIGGTYANVRADFLQGIVMAVLTLVVFVTGYLSLPDGFASLHQSLASRGEDLVRLINPSSSVFNSPWALLSIAWLLFIFVANPHLIAVVLSLKNGGEFRKFISTAAVSLFIFQLMPFSGLFGRAHGMSLEKADTVLPEFLKLILPGFFGIIIILAVVSASITTVNNLFMALSAVLTNDLYSRVSRKSGIGNSQKHRLLAGRISILLIGTAAVIIALNQPSSLTTLIWIGINGVLSGVVGPLIAGMFLPHAHRTAAVASFLTGIGSYLLLYPGIIGNVMTAGALSSIIGLLTMLVVTFAVQPPGTHSTAAQRIQQARKEI